MWFSTFACTPTVCRGFRVYRHWVSSLSQCSSSLTSNSAACSLASSDRLFFFLWSFSWSDAVWKLHNTVESLSYCD